MEVVRIDQQGNATDMDISRKDLVEKFDIHSRDLRPVFAKKQHITIFPRGDCIIFNYRSVKLVIGTKEVYVFGLDNPKIRDYLLPPLLDQIQSRSGSIRFEHLILETTLAYILQKIQRRYDEIERTSEQILEKLNVGLHAHQTFEQLLHLKKFLSKLETHAQELEDAINEIVEDDEELRDFYLGTKKVEDTEEIESILENALEQIADISNKIDELDSNIDDSQSILTLKMDHMRTTIGKIDLLSNASAAMLTLLAVITGLYGMNIQNGLEDDPVAFWIIAFLTGLAFLFGLAWLLLWLKRNKIL